MAEALVSFVLQELALIQQVEAEVKLVVGVEDEVQKLTSNFIAIKAVLEDAENRQVKEVAVRDWLGKLNDISYDIQDVVDEWNTAVRKLHMKKIKNASKFMRKVRSIIPAYRFSPKQLVLRRDIATKIKNLNKTLDNIAREKDMFGFRLGESSRELERQITTSVVDPSNIYGRYEEKDVIVDWLLSDSSHGEESLPIISIVGMGGIGKTTLARLAYRDDRVNTHFDKRIWVCVSHPFEEVRIARAILESLQGVEPTLVELDTILETISQSIHTERFLLVLDDVWTEDARKWEQLRDSLRHGSRGSRILLTTRKENVAKVMGTTKMITVGKLPKKECWQLFSRVAFSGRTKEQCDELEYIGRKIVKKCKGLPLALKTMGSLLSLKTRVEQWQNVLDSEMWKLDGIEEGLFVPLLFSYYDLPTNLRKCFSYCAIFPKDYEIEKDKLIKFWMAQGYLKVEGREDMELVGEEYFEKLAMRSLFQDFETNNKDGNIIRCKMHDIVHDFTQYLTKNECLAKIVDDDDAADQLEFAFLRARHSMIILLRDDSFPISVSKETKLRTLVIEHYCDGDDDFSNRVKTMFDKFRCLRVLRLGGSYSSIEKIPRGLGNLIHLRYLSLEEFRGIKELPEALCDLYNLQTLDISFCTSLEKLPKGIGKLINLRHLLNDQTSLSFMPKEMERLTNLRTINEFPLSCYGHDSKACTVQCLKNFKYLRGSLDIVWLGSVTDISEVKNADMKSMQYLLHLDISFYKKEEEVEEVRLNVEHNVILEALQPPPNLEKLEIWFFKSKTMTTNWMASLTNLKILEIHSSENLERLPSLGKLPSLESLSISTMNSLRKVGREFLGIESADTTIVAFPKLKSLEFNTIPIWEEWDYEFLGGEDIVIMSCLHSLKLFDCPKLKALPDHILQSTTLKELKIYD